MSAGSVESHVWTRRLLGGVALIALAALGVVTWHALRIEASEARTRRAAAEQESLRLALWRMDSLMTPILAREAARPYFEYESFYPAGRAYTDVLLGKEIREGEVMLPSPLLSNVDPVVQMHFQQIGDKIESPQAPTGSKRDLAEGVYLSQYAATVKQSKLAELRGLLARAPMPSTPLYTRATTPRRLELGSATENSEYKQFGIEPSRQTTLFDNIAQGVSNEQLNEKDTTRSLESRDSGHTPTTIDGVIAGMRATEPLGGVMSKPAADSPTTQTDEESATAGMSVVPADAAGRANRKESPLEQVQREDYQKRAALTKQAQSKGQNEANNITSRNARTAGNASTGAAGDVDNSTKNDQSTSQPGRTQNVEDQSHPARSRADDEKSKSSTEKQESGDAKLQLSPAPASVPSVTSEAGTQTRSPSIKEEEQSGKQKKALDLDGDWGDEAFSLPSEISGPESSQLKFGTDITLGEQAEVVLGDFQASWITKDTGKAPELVFRRMVRVGEKEFQQGFWINWTELQRTLVDPVKDIYPAAALQPVTQSLDALPSATLGRMLASIPAELVVPALPEVGVHSWTPLRTALLATWVLVALALVTLGLAARAMAELAERRGQFVSAVTHELRTPLTTFRLYSQMLSEGMIQDEQAKRGYAQTLFSESQRLGRIVESVLDYARLGKHGRARPMELQWESRTVGELATQMDATLQGVASQHGMTLELDGPTAGPNSSLREVRVDITRLERIMVNLVENAGKYGKPIDALGEHRAVVRWDATGPRVRISVRDFGAGISAREAKNIFRPFTRGEAHAHGSTPGMGLGLSLARGLAEQMGGSLAVQAPQDGGLGAEFVVDLPT